ncbi:MAG: 50S ribosomal protein L6 [Clostridia bacterium]|nr:50S ribosomal protein L6 [Clostridia bacterium]
MSRIGNMPITLPEGVEIKIGRDNKITVKGPQGTLEARINPDMKVKSKDGVVTVTRPTEDKEHKSLHGLSRTLINNMVVGVSQGFEKKLEVEGVGYRATKQGDKLVMNLGYSHQVEMAEIEGIKIEVPDQNTIIVKGVDKQKVGQFAAEIREKRPPEPYKGKGIRYAGEVIKRKEGKTGAKKK